MPKAFDASERRIAALKKQKSLPANLSKATLTEAPAQLKSARDTWELASTARASGDSEEARIQMNLAKFQIEILITALGVNVSLDSDAATTG